MPADLEKYRRKRDFGRTPEPAGEPAAGEPGRLRYVIQKHDARRLHYDLRLEHEGVLKSWAVPKAPSLEPKEKRLAVQTEDHPLEYGGFEGVIPENQYGAGSVLIWDRGYWTPLGDPGAGLRDGKLDFELHGDRLRGRWTLVRTARRDARKGPDNWLLIKRSDGNRGGAVGGRRRAPSDPRQAPAPPALDLQAVPGARRQDEVPAAPAPQLATLVERPPEGAGWLHEPKLDGYRLLCRIEDGRVALLTRRGNDWTDRFEAIAAAARALPCRGAVLDGEAVVHDTRGRTDFQRLQAAIGRGDPAIVLVAFDLLHLDGWDLRGAALHERKRVLAALLEDAPGNVRYGEHVEGHGAAFYRESCRLGLEGVIAKRAGDRYREGRTRSWLKIKCLRRQEFVVVGFTDPRGSRAGFGALLLGTRREAGAPLRYAGRVGTGFDEATLHALRARLDGLARREPPVTDAPRARGVHWVEPVLVAEVAFGEWTSDGVLRHPTFKGLREDKPAAEVVEERPDVDAPRGEEDAAAGSGASERRGGSGARRRGTAAVQLTSPDKVLFPEEGVTKRGLAEYWADVAEYALPLLERRPLTLLRCPEGHAGQCFYQKHIGAGTPETVGRVRIDEDEDPYAMVDGLPALLGLVQIGVLELHVWGSRIEHLEQPDIIVFDLDPSEELAWGAVVEAAFDLKRRIEALGLCAFARLTGGKGLHVVVPVEPGPAWPAVKRFSRALVHEMVRDEPKRYTGNVSKSRREGKIFIDYLRNGRGATAIASYSPRARSGAPVALPVEWDALEPNAAAPPRFGLLEVPELVRRRARDPWEGFESARRPLV